MALRDVYETGFDEGTDKQLSATCPECDGTVLADAGERHCSDCGLVITDQRLDRGPEWRSFDDDDAAPRRTGAQLTEARHDRGLSTEIGFGTNDPDRNLSSRKTAQVQRLRREHNRARFRSTAERNLAHACGEITRMTSALDLPESVRERAAAIYREAMQENLIRGRAIETIAAGCVYAACRCDEITRTTDEVAAVARCDEPKVTLGYRVLNQELGLDAAPRHPPALVRDSCLRSMPPAQLHVVLGGSQTSRWRLESRMAGIHTVWPGVPYTSLGRNLTSISLSRLSLMW